MEAVMASELAQLESRTASAPQQETGPEKEDVDFEFNGEAHLAQCHSIVILISIPPVDEKDVFESDFESTDEEVEAGADEEQDSIAERYIQEEERRTSRVCTSKHDYTRDPTPLMTTHRKRKHNWSELRR